MKLRTAGLLAIAALGLIAGAALAQEPGTMEHPVAAPVTRAIAVMNPTEGSSVSGTVTFEQVDGGLHVTADLNGLTPGDHGFHVHEYGDCSAPDGTSAGGHFNPEHVDHGAPDGAPRHVGDFGNIVADAEGHATYDRVDTMATFEGAHSILGRGVIVHAGADDLTSQPTGAAGARAACGVIGVAAPAAAE